MCCCISLYIQWEQKNTVRRSGKYKVTPTFLITVLFIYQFCHTQIANRSGPLAPSPFFVFRWPGFFRGVSVSVTPTIYEHRAMFYYAAYRLATDI